MAKLPDELWLSIKNKSGLEESISLSRTCKHLHNLFTSNKTILRSKAIETLAERLTEKVDYSYLPILGDRTLSEAISQKKYIQTKITEFFIENQHYTIASLRQLISLLDIYSDKLTAVVKGFYYKSNSESQHNTFRAILNLIQFAPKLADFIFNFAKFCNLNINARDICGYTVLEYALTSKNTPAVYLLLKGGANSRDLSDSARQSLANLLEAEHFAQAKLDI